MLSFIINSFYSFKKAKSIIGEIQITFAAFYKSYTSAFLQRTCF